MAMPLRSQPPPGPFARAVSDQIRHTLTDHRISGAKLARMIDRSQSYMSTRLRNEASFTVQDVEAICEALGEDLLSLLRDAVMASRRALAHDKKPPPQGGGFVASTLR